MINQPEGLGLLTGMNEQHKNMLVHIAYHSKIEQKCQDQQIQ